jgi:hypothetical protein
MQFIRMIAKQVTVFNQGSVLVEDAVENILRNPLVRDIYIRVGSSPLEMIKTPAVPIWVAVMFAALFLKRAGPIDSTLLLLLATSVGFMVGFFLQRKGWPPSC